MLFETGMRAFGSNFVLALSQPQRLDLKGLIKTTTRVLVGNENGTDGRIGGFLKMEGQACFVFDLFLRSVFTRVSYHTSC